MTNLFTSPRIQRLKLAKSRETKEFSYVDFVAGAFINSRDVNTLGVIKTTDDLCNLYKAQGYSDLLTLMKTMQLCYVLGAKKAHEEAHNLDFLENISKSLDTMDCSKCGTAHARKDHVVCQCGTDLYDNKGDN